MTSILTNTGSMVALQTLRNINTNLAKTQDEISTGKSISSAKDNSAVWAISKVMESDVAGFKAISDSLALGGSAIAVASNASEKITSLLTDMKKTIIAAQDESADRPTLQNDIDKLRNQINSIVDAAQFNGVNLLQGTDDMSMLSSLDRSSGGSVAVSSIDVSRQDLTTDRGSYGTTAITGAATAGAATAANTANTGTLTLTGTPAIGNVVSFKFGEYEVNFTATSTTLGDMATGVAAAINALGLDDYSASAAAGVVTLSSTNAFETTALSATSTGVTSVVAGTTGATIAARAENVTFSERAVSDGDGYRVTLGGANYDYIAGKGETTEDVAKGLKAAIDSAHLTGIKTNVVQDSATQLWSLQIDNDNATSQSLAVAATSGGTATGGLQALSGIDVTTEEFAASALDNIETLIQTATKAAASFGSAASRVEIQNSFVSSLSDSMTAGIGALVDADMEEVSARLQALQTQQQLGIQSLSIANQAPQNVLSLFK